MNNLIFNRKEITFFIFLAFFLSFISTYWGPSTDELHQQPYGLKAYDFYKSLGSDDTVINYKKGELDELMVNYGALVDTVPQFFYDVTNADLYTIRHIIFTLFGFLYLLYGYRIGKLFGDWRYGLVTLILLIFLPRLFGEMFNNPKDIPFGGAYVMAIYYIIKLLIEFPTISRNIIIKTALAIGITATIRVGGFLLFFYLILFLGIKILINSNLKEELFSNFNFVKSNFYKLFALFLLGYFICIILWPSALISPLNVPYDAFTVFSKFPVTVRTLFDGKWIQSNEVPPFYIVKYFLISNPEIIFIGLFSGLFLLKKHFSKEQKLHLGLLLFSSLFPISIIIYKKSSLYNGWRQEYFTFMPLVIISGIFWSHLLFKIKNNILSYIFKILFILLLSLPIYFVINNFPHFYVYFNTLSGGIDKNYGKYEMDYYGHSVNEATFWIQKNYPEWFKDSTVKVVSNVPYNMSKILDRWQYKKQIGYVRYRERYDSDWDIGIFSPAFVDPNIFKNDLFKSKNTIHSIDIDGKPIGIIIKRTDKNDYLAKKLIDSNKFTEAIPFLNKALEYDPNNEIALTNLGFCQLNTNQAPLAVESLKKALVISPESLSALNFLGYAYLQTGNVNYAQYIFLQMIDQNPNNPEPYKILSQIYQQQGNTQAAQQYMGAYQQITGSMGR